MVLEDGPEHCDARRDPDLPEGRVRPGAHPRLLGRDDADRRRRERRVHEPDPDPEQDESGKELTPSRRRGDAVHEHERECAHREAAADQRPDRRVVESFPEIGATTNASSEMGRKRIPVSSGE